MRFQAKPNLVKTRLLQQNALIKYDRGRSVLTRRPDLN